MTMINLPWLDADGRLRLDRLQIRNGHLVVAGQQCRMEISEITAATEQIVVPGYIDAHVHFRQPGLAYKEGIANGCLAALAGGVTAVFDMPNTNPPTCTAAALAAKRRLWNGRAKVGWGLFIGCDGSEICSGADKAESANGRNGLYSIPTPENLGIDSSAVAAMKVFMARSGSCAAVNEPEVLAQLMLAWPRIAVHAEDEREFPRTATGLTHEQLRPRISVIAALHKLEKALELAEKYLGRLPDCRLILLHLATSEEVQWVRRMKERGYKITAETCPHYLYFTNADLAEYGAQLQVNPPIREADDQAMLWQGLVDGTIDMVNSDHAPHTQAEKASANPPSGIPGIERMWQLLALAADSGRISWRRALALAGQNAAKCYGIVGRGELTDGARADLVVLRRNKAADSYPPRKIVTRAGYDAYRHLQFPWEVERVLIAGKTAWEQHNSRALLLAEEVYAARPFC
ncbi:MAG TPA: hypothetical protein DCG57_10885 [Candidatus Riflebacteria bacterium]|jgi:dihydroorotase (multifunctional complex type)|nr:hypothetical protein [Candidatus Riflebacteria bacterium]